MSPAERERVDALFDADEPAIEDVAEVTGIVAANGGLEYAHRRGEEYAERASEALDTLPPGPARDALGAAISYVMERHF
jgi:octaprenyl-diphosphate synthase